jgi:lysophospholipase L1-like esterase
MGRWGWKDVGLAVMSVAVVLAGVEAGLRALGLPAFDACWAVAEPFWQEEPDPELGWLYRPGAEVARATVNERGLRGPVLPAARDAARERLLFVGDSTCFGIWVPLEDTFAARASAELEAARGRPVEYEIAALPGYSSWHSRVLTRRLAPVQRPDRVVLYVGAYNDHASARYYRDDQIPERLARRHAAWHDVRLLRLAESAADQAWHHFGRKLVPAERSLRVPPAAFADNLRATLREIRAAGAEALVLSPPWSARQRADRPEIPRYHGILAAVAREEGAALLDLAPLFAAGDEAALYQRDGVHLSAAGHALAAGAIAERLAAVASAAPEPDQEPR